MTKWLVRPAKTQINLGIRPVWSESLLSAWRNLGTSATQWAHSEDSDQTGRMPRLIWVFAGHTCYFASFVVRWLKLNVCPGKMQSDQSSLGTLWEDISSRKRRRIGWWGCAGWSVFLVHTYDWHHFVGVAVHISFEPQYEKKKKWCAPNNDSDQPGHLPSLISLCCVLNGLLDSQSLKVSSGDQRTLWADWAINCPGWSDYSLGAHAILLV